jgi:hypothetical protein
MLTVQETVDAIVARSGNVVIPPQSTFALVRGRDGRYRLGERLTDKGNRLGVKLRGIDG